jgi:MFS transporter, ACS family, hexuronate transporter
VRPSELPLNAASHAGATAADRIPAAAWWILALSSLDSVLGIIDRQAASILKLELQSAYDIGDGAFGLIVSAFLLGYAICYIPAGRLVDRYGSRATLTCFILVWSAATVLTGLATSYEALLLWRFVLGAAEAGLVPATVFALFAWFPEARRTTAFALRGPITALGPILAPSVIAALALAYGWRAAFVVPGCVGLAFAAAWWLSDRRGGAPSAARLAARPSLMAVLRHRPLHALIVARLISDPLWFFLQYWQAGYFRQVLGLSLAGVGALLWIPPLLSTIVTVVVSAGVDARIRRGGSPLQARGKALLLVAGLAPLMMLIPLFPSVTGGLILFTVAQFVCWTWLSLSNVMAASVAPAGASATAVAILGALGTAGAALFNTVAGPVIGAYGYNVMLIAGACLHPLAAIIVWIAYVRPRLPA